jgi:hypothetical protein
MIEPLRPTERYIERRVEFHESGAEFYRQHQQSVLEAWSRQMAADWRRKLPQEPRPAHDGKMLAAGEAA